MAMAARYVQDLYSAPPGLVAVTGTGDVRSNGRTVVPARRRYSVLVTDTPRTIDLRMQEWRASAPLFLWLAGPWRIVGPLLFAGASSFGAGGCTFTFPIPDWDRRHASAYDKGCYGGIDRTGARSVATFGCTFQDMGTMATTSKSRDCADYGQLSRRIGPSRDDGTSNNSGAGWHANTLSGVAGGIVGYRCEDFEWGPAARVATSIATNSHQPVTNMVLRNGWLHDFPNAKPFQFNERSGEPRDRISGVVEKMRLWNAAKLHVGTERDLANWGHMTRRDVQVISRKPPGDAPWKRWHDGDPAVLAHYLIALAGL